MILEQMFDHVADTWVPKIFRKFAPPGRNICVLNGVSGSVNEATRPVVVSLARTLVLVGLASLVILVLFPAAMAAQAATA
jgi:hypothetical protein